MINKVILVGNLGADPEIRRLNSGEPVANMRIATSDNWTDRDTGEKRERTEWHSVVIFGKLAEVAEKYLKKGKKVFIEGKLQTRSWEDQEGNKRYTTEVVVHNFGGIMKMLDSAGQSNRPPGVESEEEYGRVSSRGSSRGDDLADKYPLSGAGGLKGYGNQTPIIDDEIPF